MEIIIQEGAREDTIGMVFVDVSSYEIVENKVTRSFMLNVYSKDRLVGILPYNVKTTIITFLYEDANNEPGQNTKY